MVGRGYKLFAALATLNKAYAKMSVKSMKKYSISWLLLSFELHAGEDEPVSAPKRDFLLCPKTMYLKQA